MICGHCGKETQASGEICVHCGESLLEKSQPVENVAQPETVPVQQSQPEGSAVTFFKKYKKLCIGVAVGAVALMVVFALLLNLGAVYGWALRTFLSPQELLVRAYQDMSNLILSPAVAIYDNALEHTEPTKDSATGSLIHIRPSENLLEWIGDGENLSWLSELSLQIDRTKTDDLAQAVFQIGNKDAHIITLQQLTDRKNQITYLSVPELHRQALARKTSDDEDNGPSGMDILQDGLPAGNTVKSLLDRYMLRLLGSFTDVEKSTQTMTIEDLSQSLTVLTARMDRVEFYTMCIDLLENAKQDEQLNHAVAIFSESYQSALTQELSGKLLQKVFTPQDLYAQFLQWIDGQIETLQKNLEAADPESQFALKAYLNTSNLLVGCHVIPFQGESAVGVLLVQEGDQLRVQVLTEKGQLDGICTLDHGIAGNITASENGKTTLEIQLTAEKVKDELSYCVKIDPSLTVIDSILEKTDFNPIVEALLSKTDMRFAVDGTMGDASMYTAVAVDLGGSELLSFDVTNTPKEPQTLSVPEDHTDPNAFTGAVKWLIGLDYVALMENAVNAGAPENLITQIIMGIFSED